MRIIDDHLYREKQIIGGPKSEHDPIIPVSHSTWWKGIQEGVFPQGTKLSAGVTVWRGADLRKVVEGKWQGSA